MPITLTRSLLTILIPGIVAIAPWLLALVQNSPATLGYDKYPVLANALVFSAAAVAGSMFEGVATFIEVRWDRERETDFDVGENWFKYLSRVLTCEPVGYRYLSRLVTSMYFDLTMLFAIPFFLVGVCILASLRFPDGSVIFCILTLLAVVLSAKYFLFQAKSTHLTLCSTRKQMNERIAVS